MCWEIGSRWSIEANCYEKHNAEYRSKIETEGVEREIAEIYIFVVEQEISTLY